MVDFHNIYKLNRGGINMGRGFGFGGNCGGGGMWIIIIIILLFCCFNNDDSSTCL